MLANIAKNFSVAAKVEATERRQHIDVRQFGVVTYRVETAWCSSGSQWQFGLDIEEFKSGGRAGHMRRVIFWEAPARDDTRTMREVARRIIEASAAGSLREDSRTRFERCVDWILGAEHVNDISVLARHSGPRKRVLSARITREKPGLLVTLFDRLEGATTIIARLPLESVRMLSHRLERV